MRKMRNRWKRPDGTYPPMAGGAQQSATTMSVVLKEAWSADRLQAQFESKNTPLGKLEAYRGVVMGRTITTPILTGRAGAFTVVGAAGGTLNPAQPQPVGKASWSMPYNWFQIELDTSALVQSGQDIQGIVAGKDLEVKGAVENTRHQMARQVVTGGDGIVIAFDTGTAAQTLKVVSAAQEGASYGYSALVRGWVQPGFPIAIGITSNINSLSGTLPAGPNGAVAQPANMGWVTAVNKSASAPTITLQAGASIATTLGTNFGYVVNPNDVAQASPEMNGIRQLIGTVGMAGLDQAVAGQEFWAGAMRDTTTTTFSLDLALNLQRLVMQNSNNAPAAIWTGYKQQMNFYALLQSQVQFSGDQNLAAGNVDAPTWNGMKLDAMADILDTDWFMLTPSDMFRIKGNMDQPRWASDIQGSSQGAIWRPGTTRFTDGVVYPVNLGCQRRNTQAGAINLK
jgi:hypothetical protein